MQLIKRRWHYTTCREESVKVSVEEKSMIYKQHTHKKGEINTNNKQNNWETQLIINESDSIVL